jgi:2'-5' RNA ligase
MVRMSRYFVGHKVGGETASDFYLKVTKELADKFGITNLGERVAPHLTLKPPFEIQNLGAIEKEIEKIAKRAKPLSFTLGGLGVFEGRDGATVFWKVHGNWEFKKQIQQIADDLAIFGENGSSLPRPIKAHLSLARYVKGGDLKAVLDFLENREVPWVDAEFNNLSIFEFIPGGWQTYKSFGIK